MNAHKHQLNNRYNKTKRSSRNTKLLLLFETAQITCSTQVCRSTVHAAVQNWPVLCAKASTSFARITLISRGERKTGPRCLRASIITDTVAKKWIESSSASSQSLHLKTLLKPNLCRCWGTRDSSWDLYKKTGLA